MKSLPVQGTYVTKKKPNDKGQGVYIFRASYKDRGANGLPSIASEEMFTLRSPNINPTKYDEFSNVNKMSFGGNSFVIPTKHGSYIGLKLIDLAGINEIEFMAVAPKSQLNAEGGTIEVHIDSPTGTLIGKSDFIGDVAGSGFAPRPVPVKIQSVKGEHDVYAVFQNPNAKSGVSLMVVMNSTFKMANPVAPSAVVANEKPVDLNEYVGKFAMTGLHFSHILLSVKDNKLMMDAGGQVGEIKPTGEPDQFDADGRAKIQFLRSDEQKVIKLKMDAMGFSFEGAKE